MGVISRMFATAALAAGLVLTGCGNGSSDGRSAFEREGDFAKGRPDAPLTFIEYASTACPACAYFHAEGKPVIDRYVADGTVRYVFREFITGLPALATPGFMLARCAPEERYFDVLDLLFSQQQTLVAAIQQGRGQQQFRIIARTAGLSDAEFQACMNNDEIFQAVTDANNRASREGIRGTPTFIINGVTLEAIDSPDGRLTSARHPVQVFAINGRPISDDQGIIDQDFDADTTQRIIAYFLAREGVEAQADTPEPADGDAG
ncbi:DsbA family protein [Alkalicaulis satelles]|uniref:DsbA family protein n=1 Tax=Alkalicaulis satelles TaxID=2609175 RepID=A0A5M6ZK81_9PROT|nr:thioredoxin domain-containing protein [Alkalicaulis satelles]KAA5805242.1 DsbA family protein [Alkalicaulis satelles]